MGTGSYFKSIPCGSIARENFSAQCRSVGSFPGRFLWNGLYRRKSCQPNISRARNSPTVRPHSQHTLSTLAHILSTLSPHCLHTVSTFFPHCLHHVRRNKCDNPALHTLFPHSLHSLSTLYPHSTHSGHSMPVFLIHRRSHGQYASYRFSALLQAPHSSTH